MKEQDIKNLGFNEATTRILLDINKADIDDFKGFMYSLENSKKDSEMPNLSQQFKRDVEKNAVEYIMIKFNQGIFTFQILEVEKNGKLANSDESYLKISPEKKLAVLKTPYYKNQFAYENGEFKFLEYEKTK